MTETGESEFGLWDDKRFECGCYVKQRRERSGWVTLTDMCIAHQKDDALQFFLLLARSPHKARWQLMAENRKG